MCTTDVIYTGFKYLRPEVIGRLVPQFILHPDSLLTQLRTDSISTLDRLSMYLCISPHRLRLDFPSTQTRLPIDSDSTPIDSESIPIEPDRLPVYVFYVYISLRNIYYK